MEGMSLELTQIVETIDQLLPQLKNFIGQFNQLVASSGINVVTDLGGNMSLDVPSSMPDDLAEHLGRKIGVIDRLITTRGQEIDGLLHKSIEIENKLESSEFKSKILERVAEFQKLNKSYKH
uniref:COX1 n=1 Tax=Emericellopsis sp. 1a5 TaxID=1761922 RepID=A0A141IQF6_9HYPO|nr:COX1 [Emericellopsis sp. 1a5]